MGCIGICNCNRPTDVARSERLCAKLQATWIVGMRKYSALGPPPLAALPRTPLQAPPHIPYHPHRQFMDPSLQM